MKDKLTAWHRQLLNRVPTPTQMSLYTEAPEKHGFTSAHGLTVEQEREMFEAVFVLGLSRTATANAVHPIPTVYLLVPPSIEAWANQQLRRIAVEIFAICKLQMGVNPEHAKIKAKHLGELFRHVLVGSRLSSTTTEPDLWVGYGFDSNDSGLPNWVGSKLVAVYPFLRDDGED